jgi:plastocyanin
MHRIIDQGPTSRRLRLRSQAAATLSFLLLTVACAKSAAVSSPSTQPSASSPLETASLTSPGPLASFAVPSGLKRGEAVTLLGNNSANFAGKSNVSGEKSVTIDIVPVSDSPAFSPTILLGSPGQTLSVTVYQTDTPSAFYQHNFSVPALGIDKDIPLHGGHKVTVTVTLPQSGALIFYCKYHIDEGHSGVFVVSQNP